MPFKSASFPKPPVPGGCALELLTVACILIWCGTAILWRAGIA